MALFASAREDLSSYLGFRHPPGSPVMHAIRSAVLLFGIVSALLAHAAVEPAGTLVGQVYASEATVATPAFTVARSRQTQGDRSVLTERYQDMDGNTAAVLVTTFAAGSLQSIDFRQDQSGESAAAVFRDGKVFFTQTANGLTKKGDQIVEGRWVALSAVPDEIVGRWDAVTAGKTLTFAMPVPIMRDHFVFTISKERSWTADGRRLTAFRMEARSMVIRLMADPFHYVFDDESRSLVEFRGTSIVKAGTVGHWKDMPARIVYGQPPSPPRQD